jgi:hypothetical protein
MKEIIFIVETDPDSGFVAQAKNESIFTQADDMESLKKMTLDAVYCHFPNEQDRPQQILLRMIHDEVVAL